MTTDADERPKDETALEAEVNEASAPVAEAPAEDPAPAAETPPDAPAPEAPMPAAETPADAPAPEAPVPAAETPADAPAPEAPMPAAETPSADAPADAAAQVGDSPAGGDASAETPAPPGDTPAEAGAQTPGDKGDAKPAAKKPRRRKPRERRKAVPEVPRARVPLPLDELRDASRSTMNLFGPRKALRDALGVLAPREKQELNVLIAADEDHRPRARNIANGSIGAGRIDKAMAATIVSMAPQEELWGVLLDKEQAAQKLGRIREAKQRDKQRADRAKERANRSDRVSREDMEKATDGRVGATIRFVTADEKRDRRDKDATSKKPSGGGSVLDRLGY